jgi:mycothiol synthase
MKYRSVRWPADGASLDALFAAVRAADGTPPLSEHKALRSRPLAPGEIGVVGMADGGVAAYAHASPHPGGWGIEAVVCPDERSVDVFTGLLARTIETLPHGDPFGVWATDPAAVEASHRLGLREVRALHQLRRQLPAAPGKMPAGFEIRTFRSGRDEGAWLEVNNAAFASHPENAAMSAADLALRLQQPWFDPAGLLLAWRDDALAGFCWMKLHDRALGEIYIIGVHPRMQGRGLGTALALEGLAYAHRAGAAEGMLYVEGNNDAGLRLYRSLGFEIRATNRMHAPPADEIREIQEGSS